MLINQNLHFAFPYICCCYGNSFGPTQQVTYNIKAYKDAKHDQGS